MILINTCFFSIPVRGVAPLAIYTPRKRSNPSCLTFFYIGGWLRLDPYALFFGFLKTYCFAFLKGVPQ